MIRAIIFDFDGVIGNSEKSRFNVFKKIFKSKGLVLPDSEFKNMVGRTSKVFLGNLQVKNLSEALKSEIQDDYNNEYKGNITNYVTPITPVVDFIKNYHGTLKLAVASGSDYKILHLLTKNFGIRNMFEILIGKEQVTQYKPNPETYLITAKALNVKPEECMVIEDSIVGVQAAIKAGTVCYVFLNGLNNKEDFKDLQVASFLETRDDFNKLI